MAGPGGHIIFVMLSQSGLVNKVVVPELIRFVLGGGPMRQWLQKRPIQPAQEQAPQKLGPSSGISNQAVLSMLKGQDTPAAPCPASGGTPLDKAMQARMERQFGLPMGDVRIHHNSDEPAKFDAGAYTYGTDIFIGPGQEKLLNHEMTHVAQQKLGQVRPTGIEHGMAVNRSPVLEHSADMGTVPQVVGGASGKVVQCGDDSDTEQTPPASKGRKRPAPSSTDVEPKAKRVCTFFNVAELQKAPSGLNADKTRLKPGTKDVQFPQLTPADLAFCFPKSSKEKESSSKAGDPPAALFDSEIVKRFTEKRERYERKRDNDKRLNVVHLLSKRIVRAQGRELSRYLTKAPKRRPTSAFGDKAISAGSNFVMPLLFEGDPSEQIVVRAGGYMGTIKALGRFIHQGKQPYLSTSPRMSTRYDDIVGTLNTLDQGTKKYVFHNILSYLTADTEPVKCMGVLTDTERRTANTLAALLVVESHYSRALSDGGKFARAAIKFCRKNPNKLRQVFGSNGAFTMSRFAGGETTDTLLEKQELKLFEKVGKKKSTVYGKDKVNRVHNTLRSIAAEMSDSSDEEDAPPRRKPRRHKKRPDRGHEKSAR